jgi:hypothetical protein
MTKLLERAFKKASKLPQVEQNLLAKWLMEELEAESKWERKTIFCLTTSSTGRGRKGGWFLRAPRSRR